VRQGTARADDEMKSLLVALVFLASLSLTRADDQASKPLAARPIPYIPWQDVKTLYGPNHYPGDWDHPKVADLPHKDELVERCKRDLTLSFLADSDPLKIGRVLPPGKLVLTSINKDSKNQIIYFVFSYNSELITDLFVVYYYDQVHDRFILKIRR
jgi:hypothetical protein